MLVPIKEVSGPVDANTEKLRAWNDMLQNASKGMMSWAEKSFKLKLIDKLYHMDYYKYNQTIYLKDNSKE